MNEEIKRVLENTAKILKSKGGLNNKDIKPVIISIEKIVKRRSRRNIKRA